MKAILTPSSLAETLRNIVMDIADFNPDAYDLHASFKSDLGLDSLDMVELIMICEKDFLVHLPDQEWTNLSSPAELLTLIQKKKEYIEE